MNAWTIFPVWDENFQTFNMFWSVCVWGGDKYECIFGTTTNISGFCRATERPSKQSTPSE